MFKKYTKIRNSYDQKNIDKTLEANNLDYDLPVTIQEKLHGANFSVIGWINNETYEVELDYYSRNQKVTGTNFYNVEQEVLDKVYVAELKLAVENMLNEYGKQNLCGSNHLSVQLIGELYGGKIQKGVDYGKEKRIDFYDMVIVDNVNNERYYMPPEDFYHYSYIGNLQIVPNLENKTTLKEALEFDVESLQTMRGTGGAEGIVIKPYSSVYFTPNGDLFYIKKKSKAFEERKSVKKNRKPNTEKDIFAKDFQKEFEGYITANRFDSVISKHGKLTDKKEIGKYCVLLTDDAKEDFINDNPELVEKAKEFFTSDKEFNKLFKSREVGKIVIQNSDVEV